MRPCVRARCRGKKRFALNTLIKCTIVLPPPFLGASRVCSTRQVCLMRNVQIRFCIVFFGDFGKPSVSKPPYLMRRTVSVHFRDSLEMRCIEFLPFDYLICLLFHLLQTLEAQHYRGLHRLVVQTSSTTCVRSMSLYVCSTSKVRSLRDGD